MSILSDISSGAVGGLLGGIGILAKDLRQAITGDLPAEKQAEIQQKIMEIELAAAQAQTKINEVEAASSSLFVAGWRPGVGWICAAGLFFYCIGNPLFMWAMKIGMANWGWAAVDFPKFDYEPLFALLFGMLGLGGYRTFEKVKGVNR